MKTFVLSRWIVVLGMALGGILGGGCQAGGVQQPAQLQQDVMERRFTTEEVDAVRRRTRFDERAMPMLGVVGVGTGGVSPTDSWIMVMCVDEAVRDSIRQVLGMTAEGVPIRYTVSGVIRPESGINLPE